MPKRVFSNYDDTHVPAFEKQESVYEDITVTVTEEGALLDTGLIQVRVQRKPFRYTFEKEDSILTSCDFRNLGYIRWDRQPKTVLPTDNYNSDPCADLKDNRGGQGNSDSVVALPQRAC